MRHTLTLDHYNRLEFHHCHISTLYKYRIHYIRYKLHCNSPDNHLTNNNILTKLAEFGKNLRIARLIKGYSMEKLASVANLNPTHIGKIKRAEMAPTLLAILALLEALEVDFNSFVSYKKS